MLRMLYILMHISHHLDKFREAVAQIRRPSVKRVRYDIITARLQRISRARHARRGPREG